VTALDIIKVKTVFDFFRAQSSFDVLFVTEDHEGGSGQLFLLEELV
jgi:hypothetical protein